MQVIPEGVGPVKTNLCVVLVGSASFLVLAGRVEVGVGVKARAQLDRVAAVGPCRKFRYTGRSLPHFPWAPAMTKIEIVDFSERAPARHNKINKEFHVMSQPLDFTGVRALFINCTLKRSPELSNTYLVELTGLEPGTPPLP